MVEQTLKQDETTHLTEDEKISVQALARQMNAFMAEHGTNTLYAPLDPDNFTNEAYQENFALFINTLQTQFNALNTGQSTFRASWNNAAHDSLDMDIEQPGQEILNVSGCLDHETVKAFNVFLAMRAPSEDNNNAAHYSSAHNASDAAVTKQIYDTINTLKSVYSTAFSEQSIPAPDGFVYDDKLDRTIDDTMRPRIIHLQTALGLTPNSHLDEPTQASLYTLLQNNNITVDGELNALSNDHVITELDQALDARVEERRQEMRDSLHAQQSRLLGQQGFNDDESDAILHITDKATDMNNARSSLHKKLSADTAKRADDMLEQIWMLEFERRAALNGNIIAGLSDGDRALFAANDLMQHIHRGGAHNTLASKAGGQAQETQAYTDDWFFEKEAYDALIYNDHVDGIFIPGDDTPAGQMYKPAEVGNIAYNILQERLNEAGIAPHNLTQALFTGEFTLSHQDLNLVKKSFPRPSLDEILDNEDYRENLFTAMNSGLIHVDGLPYPDITTADTEAFLQRAMANEMNDEILAIKNAYAGMPDFIMNNSINDYRNKAFNKEFGSLNDLKNVVTLQNLKTEGGTYQPHEVERSGAQLAVQLIRKFRSADDFENLYGINEEEALAAISPDGTIDTTIINSNLQQQIDHYLNHVSVVDFFAQGGDGPDPHPSTMRGSFEALRARNITENVEDQVLDKDNDHTGYTKPEGTDLNRETLAI